MVLTLNAVLVSSVMIVREKELEEANPSSKLDAFDCNTVIVMSWILSPCVVGRSSYGLILFV